MRVSTNNNSASCMEQSNSDKALEEVTNDMNLGIGIVLGSATCTLLLAATIGTPDARKSPSVEEQTIIKFARPSPTPTGKILK